MRVFAYVDDMLVMGDDKTEIIAKVRSRVPVFFILELIRGIPLGETVERSKR